MKRILTALLLLTFFAPASLSGEVSDLEKSAQAGSGKSRLALAKLYVAQGLTPNTEQQAAKWLRKIVADGQEEYLWPAMLLLVEIRKSIPGEFPNISDTAINQADGSLGITRTYRGACVAS